MEKHRTNVTRKKLGKKSRFNKNIPDVVSSSHKQATNDNSNTSTLFYLIFQILSMPKICGKFFKATGKFKRCLFQ